MSRGGETDAATGAQEDRLRAGLVERWLALTRGVLPAMAAAHRWPIRLDHCFMRVCLDAAMGRPWTEVVQRPALRHLTDAELADAIRIAEAVVARPQTLPALNAQSLRWRRAGRQAERLK